MEINLFEIFLREAIGFGFGSILRTLAKCFRCGQQDETSIETWQSNHLGCSNCYQEVSQYTNACEFTVNCYTGQIGHAAFVPAGQKWRWKGGLFEEKRLWIPYYIKAQGLRGRSLVLETSIEDYHTGRELTSHASVLNCSYDTTVWSDHSHIFGSGNFSERTSKILLVVSKIVSERRDVVFEDNRIIEPWE